MTLLVWWGHVTLSKVKFVSEGIKRSLIESPGTFHFLLLKLLNQNRSTIVAYVLHTQETVHHRVPFPFPPKKPVIIKKNNQITKKNNLSKPTLSIIEFSLFHPPKEYCILFKTKKHPPQKKVKQNAPVLPPWSFPHHHFQQHPRM